ncbi:MAG: membrane dipeptidase [Hyphomonadaceae bacterium]
MAALTRRALIGSAGAASLLPAGCLSPRSVADVYRTAIAINGNLVIPLDTEHKLPQSDADQIRRSGLTALKLTLGGGDGSRADALEHIAAVDATIALNPDLFMKVRSTSDIMAARRTGQVGVIYSFEAASMHDGRLDSIDEFRALGVLVMGLGYNLLSPFASGVLAKEPTGLTPLGREAIGRMNALGVTVDISHSDEPSSLAAIEASRKPVLITHAGCAAVQPHPRNKPDALLRKLADRGGVVGIYELSYINTRSSQPTLEDYMAHLAHALDVCGEDHVGIGSDAIMTEFEVTPESVQAWNEDIARRKAAGIGAPGEGPLPFVVGLNRSDRARVVAEALDARGYSTRVIEKVLGLNFLRVFEGAWRHG